MTYAVPLLYYTKNLKSNPDSGASLLTDGTGWNGLPHASQLSCSHGYEFAPSFATQRAEVSAVLSSASGLLIAVMVADVPLVPDADGFVLETLFEETYILSVKKDTERN